VLSVSVRVVVSPLGLVMFARTVSMDENLIQDKVIDSFFFVGCPLLKWNIARDCLLEWTLDGY